MILFFKQSLALQQIMIRIYKGKKWQEKIKVAKTKPEKNGLNAYN